MVLPPSPAVPGHVDVSWSVIGGLAGRSVLIGGLDGTCCGKHVWEGWWMLYR